MSQRDQISDLEDRVSILEAKLTVLDDQELTQRVGRIEMGYLYAKAALAIVPIVVSVLMFIDWYTTPSVAEPEEVTAVCDDCLYHPLYEYWLCGGCVEVEDVEATDPDVPDEHAGFAPANRRNGAVCPVRKDGLCEVRFVSRYLQAAH